MGLWHAHGPPDHHAALVQDGQAEGAELVELAVGDLDGDLMLADLLLGGGVDAQGGVPGVIEPVEQGRAQGHEGRRLDQGEGDHVGRVSVGGLDRDLLDEAKLSGLVGRAADEVGRAALGDAEVIHADLGQIEGGVAADAEGQTQAVGAAQDRRQGHVDGVRSDGLTGVPGVDDDALAPVGVLTVEAAEHAHVGGAEVLDELAVKLHGDRLRAGGLEDGRSQAGVVVGLDRGPQQARVLIRAQTRVRIHAPVALGRAGQVTGIPAHQRQAGAGLEVLAVANVEGADGFGLLDAEELAVGLLLALAYAALAVLVGAVDGLGLHGTAELLAAGGLGVPAGVEDAAVVGAGVAVVAVELVQAAVFLWRVGALEVDAGFDGAGVAIVALIRDHATRAAADQRV